MSDLQADETEGTTQDRASRVGTFLPMGLGANGVGAEAASSGSVRSSTQTGLERFQDDEYATQATDVPSWIDGEPAEWIEPQSRTRRRMARPRPTDTSHDEQPAPRAGGPEGGASYTPTTVTAPPQPWLTDDGFAPAVVVPGALSGNAPVARIATRRVVKRVNLWSLFKVALILYATLLGAFLVAGIAVWATAQNAGTVRRVEKFMDQLGFDNFRFVGDKMLQLFVLFGLVVVGFLIVITVLSALVYNLIAEIVGGVEVTVIEQVAFLDEAAPATGRRGVPRPAAVRGGGRMRRSTGAVG